MGACSRSLTDTSALSLTSPLLAAPYTHSLTHTQEWKGDQSREDGSKAQQLTWERPPGESGHKMRRKEAPPGTKGPFPLSGSPYRTHWPGLTEKPILSNQAVNFFYPLLGHRDGGPGDTETLVTDKNIGRSPQR